MPDALRFDIFSASDSPGGSTLPSAEILDGLAAEALDARRALIDGDCLGKEFLGWVDLPIQAEQWLPEIVDLSLTLVEEIDHLVVTGIGGSYLGARALLEAFAEPGPCGGLQVMDPTGKEPVGPEIHFAGEQLGSAHLAGLLRRLRRKRFAVNVISKSGTTMETAVAFRLLLELLEDQHGDQADRYIIATTDPGRGALRAMADARGWRSFPIPPDLGGRFSVFSAVGLLPLAAAGLHVGALLEGAQLGRERFRAGTLAAGGAGAVDLILDNPALHYAALRSHLHRQGKAIEILACFEPALAKVGDWWAQLFGESEGKQGKGLFPARAVYSTDLHSLGQYVQDGPRHLFETFLSIENPSLELRIPEAENDGDGLNRLAGRTLAEVNHAAELGTMLAHDAGGVPVLRFVLNDNGEDALGELFYTFEAACGVSALMLGVNPFDQPGVEDYKREMRAQLES